MQKEFVLWRFSGSYAISLRLPFVGNAFHRRAKHWLSLYQHNRRWVWGTIFFLLWFWFWKGQSAYQPNQPHPLISYTERPCQDSWFGLLLLCQVISSNCVRAFYACKTWPSNTFVVIPFQQMCTAIVVHPIVEQTTTMFFHILFEHQWASTKAIWVKGSNW